MRINGQDWPYSWAKKLSTDTLAGQSHRLNRAVRRLGQVILRVFVP